MLSGAVHFRVVNPPCVNRLLDRNELVRVRCVAYGRDLRRIRPVWASTSTQITRPFCMNFRR